MKCPKCNCTVTRVTYSKELESKDRLRKRLCLNQQCNHKWYTITPPEKIIPGYEIRWGSAWHGHKSRVIKYVPSPTLEDD